ncbi:MAG TPA: carboxymuconolactone decarboxylase family protein [Candidatus Cloacimonadota bacterium]|nr:carboxymuconolactone decarboxylase family protein [Candidatus Cloacimonadota bacterium]
MKPEDFNQTREAQNELVLKQANLGIKRFFNLDEAAYQDGALPRKTKELLGLVSSAVLRCDDCIRYHLGRCFEEGVSTEELGEALNIALIVGGSIVIPHFRRAMVYWQDLQDGAQKPSK